MGEGEVVRGWLEEPNRRVRGRAEGGMDEWAGGWDVGERGGGRGGGAVMDGHLFHILGTFQNTCAERRTKFATVEPALLHHRRPSSPASLTQL